MTEKQVIQQVPMPADLIRAVRLAAVAADQTVPAWVRSAIQSKLQSQPQEKK